jgi:protein-S-isoprenylcysteine O-methyltransferase Ste14
MTRFLSFLYGLVAYVIFLGAFLYAIAFVSGSPLPLALPKTIDIGPASPVVEATIVNLLLMSLFALQHSIMARQEFKHCGRSSCRRRSSAVLMCCSRASR